jgi:transcription elongation factor Elf1
VCDANYQTYVTALSEPVDVYSQWIDACEDANKRLSMSKGTASSAKDQLVLEDDQLAEYMSRRKQLAVDEDEDEEDY